MNVTGAGEVEWCSGARWQREKWSGGEREESGAVS